MRVKAGRVAAIVGACAAALAVVHGAGSAPAVRGAATPPECSASQTDDPQVVPLGGGDQTVTITAECAGTLGSEHTFSVHLGTNLPGVSVVSFSGPSNLGQGERLDPPGPAGNLGDFGDGGYGWQIERFVPGKPYTATLTISSPNPFDVPFGQILDLVVGENLGSTDTSNPAEKDSFSPEQYAQMVALASGAMKTLVARQREALERARP